MDFENYHAPEWWNYLKNGDIYLKIGHKKDKDVIVKVQRDNSIYVPDKDVYFTSIEKAYTTLNKPFFDKK